MKVARIAPYRRRGVAPTSSPDRDYDRTLRNQDAKRFYHSKAWRRLRLVQLAISPFCEFCLERFLAVPATVVDHRVELLQAWDLRLDLSNLRSLCASCHSRRHRSS